MSQLSHRNDFYVVLPSNASMDFYPNNTPQTYRIKFPQPISLRGNWEVALAGIQYQKTWYNVNDDMKLIWHVGDEPVNIITIRSGDYATPTYLINKITSKIKKKGGAVDFLYNHLKNKCVIQVPEATSIAMHQPLMQILGFTPDQLNGVDLKIVAKYPVDINNGFNSIYVYTDIIEAMTVGDASVPLLKIIPTTGSFGETIHKAFDKLHYTPLRANYFECVQINISDDSGNPVQFHFGKSIVKLHFRPRRLSFV